MFGPSQTTSECVLREPCGIGNQRGVNCMNARALNPVLSLSPVLKVIISFLISF